MSLPINIENLLSTRTVESDRIEFKSGWNPDAIYRSICAFANDFDNTGGGYILIGIEEERGIAKTPIKGLSNDEIAEIQKKMIGFNHLINPVYYPRLFIEELDGKRILVLWVTGGTARPYEVPEKVIAKEKRYFYYIRQYANSIKANTEQTQELLGLTNQVPFDDRPNRHARFDDISPVLVQDYLRISRSRLAEWIGQRPLPEILEQMALLEGPPEHLLLRNAALMLFSERPDKFFPYAFIDLVHFPKGPADKQFIEKQFKGPVQQQIRQALDYIQGNLLHQLITKVDGQAEAIRVWNYPFVALEELLANCIYHRNYQEREPITIRIHPEAIYIYNLGGPDRSVRIEDFQKGQVFPRRYRNRRLGDFLRELELTEGKATGIPVILQALRQNGSPEPVFETDPERTWFSVKLPIHPAFVNLNTDHEPSYISSGANLENLIGSLMGDQAADQANDQVTDQANDQVTDQVLEMMSKLLLWMQIEPHKRSELLNYLGLSNHNDNVKKYIEPLENIGLIAKTLPNKPKSPKQKYSLTEKAKALLTSLRTRTG